MLASTFPLRSPLEVLKDQANLHGTMARLWFREWLKFHRKLLLLALCARYEFFVKNSLKVNALILKDMRCKPLRECLQDVLKLQRELLKMGKKVKESEKREKELNKQFWELARTMAQRSHQSD
ncbi:Nn.00g011000.m01.CDS01 [Neocucurbitaria sp. VM-36]